MHVEGNYSSFNAQIPTRPGPTAVGCETFSTAHFWKLITIGTQPYDIIVSCSLSRDSIVINGLGEGCIIDGDIYGRNKKKLKY